MFKFKKLVAMLLSLALLLSLLGTSGAALLTSALEAEESVTVIAGSDLQNVSLEQSNVQNILSQLANDTQQADAFLACGDYDAAFVSADETKTKIENLTSWVTDSGVVADDAHTVFVQGNHDSTEGIGNAISPSGANDPESGAYGVYVLNYCDTSGTEATVKTAENLRLYMNEKLEQGYSKPIFVLSHVPLHYSMRVNNYNDPEAIDYIFTVLNEAGQKGLNIIFLFGHNHSSWDHYLGGGSIYLAKGDEIFIGKRGDVTNYNTHTLNFTYMNAGYLGYYDAAGVSGTDCTLSMTKFVITGDDVTISRYSANGVCNLKAKGVRNTYHNEFYSPNKAVYTSPQVVELPAVSDTSAIGTTFIKELSVSLNGVLGVNVKLGSIEQSLADYTVEATVDGGETQVLDTYSVSNGRFVYTADLMAQDMHKQMSIVLKKDGVAVDEATFLFADYKAKLEQLYADNAEVLSVVQTLADYGSYAAYYADPSFDLTAVAAVEAVKAADLIGYAPVTTATDDGLALSAAASLNINEACDFNLKLNTAAFAGCTLTIGGEEIADYDLTESGELTVWTESAVIPEQWDEPYEIAVLRDGEQIYATSVSVMSYAYRQLCQAQESVTGLHGLLKAMYLYQAAANAYALSVGSNELTVDWDAFGLDTAISRDNTYTANGTDGNTTIFVGDSFVDPGVWTTFDQDLDLTQVDALALGVGGSTSVDWFNYIAEEAFLYDIAPKNVVFNLGNNDLHWKKYTPEKFVSYMSTLLTKVHSIMPEAKLYLFSVVERQEEAETVNNASVAPANELMQAWCEAQGEWITFVDIYSENAQYRLTADMLLTSDHVHPQLETYSTVFLPALAAAGLEYAAPVAIEYTMITNQAELEAIAGLSGNYKLANDITLDSSFSPIAGFAGRLDGGSFTVTTGETLFDSLPGSTVQNLTIALSGDITANGVLADSASTATVTNVHLLGGYSVTSESADVGGLVGSAQYTTFTRCSNAAAIIGTGSYNAGGILGTNSSDWISFICCTNSGSITAADASAGGIMGISSKDGVSFAGCSNSGNVLSTGGYKGAGGILGRTRWASDTEDSIYIYSYAGNDTVNTGTVSGYYAGGIVGYTHDGTYLTLENAVNYGTINDGSRTNNDTRCGGIVGFASSSNSIVKISDCVNEGAVTGGIVGGILGHAADAAVTVSGCSNSALITGEDYLGTGGIVGRADGSTVLSITDCTNSGTVRAYSTSDWRAGGILGYHAGGTVSIDSCINAGTVYSAINGGILGQAAATDLTITNCTNEGPVAGTNGRFAGGIAGLVDGSTNVTITDCTNSGYVTNKSGSVSQIATVNTSGTSTVSDNTESGFGSSCSNAVEITDWSQITNMWGTYILTCDITTDGTTYDFHGRLYGAGHTIYTATTLFGYTSNAEFTVQDLNVVLTADLEANSVLVNTINTNNTTVKVTLKNVHLSAQNGAKLSNSLTSMNNGALIGWYNINWVNIVNCTDTITLECDAVWDSFGSDTAETRSNTYAERVTELSTVFLGASFVDPSFWTNFNTDLSGKDALCLGIGGSKVVDWINYFNLGYFDAETDPKNLVFCLGGNDIHTGVSVSTYMAEMDQLISIVHTVMPNTSLYAFALTHRTGYSTNANVDIANAELKAWCDSSDGLVTYVDVTAFDPDSGSATLNSDGIHPLASDYSNIYLPALISAGCVIEDYDTEKITSLDQITDLYGNYTLAADIIGNTTTLDTFYGTLDGAGYTITTATTLFGTLNGASVSNLNIVLSGDISGDGALASNAQKTTITGVTVSGDYTISSDGTTGGLIGTASYITFTDCASSANVVSSTIAGGLLGQTGADEVYFYNCLSSGAVSGAESAGGIIGTSNNNKIGVYGCSNTGTVSCTGDWKGAGGIIGNARWASGIENSIYIGSYNGIATTNSGTVSGYYAGGIVGYGNNGAYLTVENAVNYGVINDGGRSNADTRCGGIVGFANSSNSIVKISDCVNEGAVTGGIIGGILGHAADAAVTISGGSNSAVITGEDYLGTGGIVGRADGSTVLSVTDCINSGTVRAYSTSDWRIGGILGYHAGGTVSIDSCTNTGTVYGAINGGILGQAAATDLTITNCTNEGPVAGTNGRFAGGIAGLVDGSTNVTITGCTNSGYVTNKSGSVSQIATVSTSGTSTVSDNTESGFSSSCANAVEITSWDQITDMYGTYILTCDIVSDGTTYDFGGRLYGAGHTIYTATTLFGSTSNAEFTIQDVNVVLTADLTARSIIYNTLYAKHATVPVTYRNVHTSAINGAVLTGTGDSTGALAGECAHTHFFNCSNSVPILSGDSSRVGGLVGWTKMGYCVNFVNCSNSGTITGSVSANMGGIVGQAHADIHSFVNCSNSADITAVSGSSGIGGIVGYLPCGATFTGCTNTGNITITGDDPGEGAGGILGRTDGSGVATITGCVNSGNVYAKYAGGILGLALDGATVSIGSSSNSGNITGTTATGGILGLMRGITLTMDDATLSNTGTLEGPWCYDLYGCAW